MFLGLDLFALWSLGFAFLWFEERPTGDRRELVREGDTHTSCGCQAAGKGPEKGLGGEILDTGLSFFRRTWADCGVLRAVCGSLGGVSIDALTENVR